MKKFLNEVIRGWKVLDDKKIEDGELHKITVGFIIGLILNILTLHIFFCALKKVIK